MPTLLSMIKLDFTKAHTHNATKKLRECVIINAISQRETSKKPLLSPALSLALCSGLIFHTAETRKRYSSDIAIGHRCKDRDLELLQDYSRNHIQGPWRGEAGRAVAL